MLGQRALTVEEYLEILKRHKWLLLIPALLGPVLGYGVSTFMPEKYTSQTLVLVEQSKVPGNIIPPIMIEELAQTLGTMQEKILSRARLEPIVRENNLFAEDAKRLPMEDLVTRMRTAVKVTPVRAVGSRDGGVPGFTISFTYSDSRTAQLVCNRITSMFIDEDLMRRQGYAQGTVNFIENQLQEAKRKLDEQEARQAEFKRRNVGQMPGQDEKHLGLLMSSNVQLEAVTQALNRAHADKTYLESMLQQYLAVSTTAPDGTSPLTVERQLSTLQSELITLEGRYTPGHPDVIKKKNEIAQMQARVEEQRRIAKAAPEKKEETAAVAIEPPHIQQIRNQVRLLDQTIREKGREQTRLQESVRLYQSRVQLSPQVEQEYKELTRDYDNAMGNYNDLLGKKTAAERSLELMKQQQGEQFRIMDAANLPSAPSEPNRLMFAGGGLGGGAALGLGIVLILEMKDKAMRNELDIEYFLELPALAQVPTVGAEAAPGRKGFRKGKPASVEQAARA